MPNQLVDSFYGLLRDSITGQILFHFSGGKIFQPPCERDDYEIPTHYLATQPPTPAKSLNGVADDDDDDRAGGARKEVKHDEDSSEKDDNLAIRVSAGSTASDEYAKNKIIVGWDGDDDPSNPQNWPGLKKFIVLVIICLCTTSLYMGSAVFTPAEEELRREYHTTQVKTMLGLTLFVWGYGLGALWFSPMSENPVFGGRNYIYLATQLIFAVLQIPTALVNHVGSFAVLRLLGGIMASPCLSTGGASFADFLPMQLVPLSMIAWAMGAMAGPFLAPLVGGALVQLHGSRYPFWFMLGISAGMFVIMVLFLPETSETALLMRKAKVLRRKTGNPNILAPGDVVAATQTTRQVLRHIFWLPIELCLKEYVLLLINIHVGLVYSVMYLYFEAYPLAYGGVYRFNLVEQGLSYLSLLVGVAIAAPLYVVYLARPGHDFTHPEKIFGPTALIGSILFPVGMLLFGWTSTRHIHWIVSMIGNAFFAAGAFVLWQSYFAFLGTLYVPEIAGSAFASNSLVRSMMAGAFPLFGVVMYEHTSTPRFPVGWGCTILALFALLLLPLPVYLWKRGEILRIKAHEKYGGKHHRY